MKRQILAIAMALSLLPFTSYASEDVELYDNSDLQVIEYDNSEGQDDEKQHIELDALEEINNIDEAIETKTDEIEGDDDDNVEEINEEKLEEHLNQDKEVNNNVVNKEKEVIKYNTNVTDMKRPALSDGFVKSPKSMDKYARMFASRYGFIETEPDHGIKVDDILELMYEDPNVPISKAQGLKYPKYAQSLIGNLHRYLPLYVDDAEYQMLLIRYSKYDPATGRYIIPTIDEANKLITETQKDFSNKNIYTKKRVATSSELEESKKVADSIVKRNIKNNMTDRQKVDTLTNALIKDTKYDSPVNEKKGYIAENTEYGALVLKRSQCDGLARAYTMLLRRAGIPSMTVYGYMRDGGNHAWNIVFVDGRWQLVDITGIVGNKSKLNKYYLKNRNQLPDHLVIEDSVYGAMMKSVNWFVGQK